LRNSQAETNFSPNDSLKQYHHPDDRAESERLRKMGAGMITDSFGEARWMGALANTRAFGDSQYK